MFDVGIWEIVVIVLVGIVVFGPDRLPDYARQAGRLARQLRRFAQSAQQDLREELGPEFADLKLTDLDPRVAFRKHILEALDDDDLDEIAKAAAERQRDLLGPGERPPYDVEAT